VTAPFAVVSDRHFHGWSAFSTVTPDGINSRLEIQLKEMRRCAAALKAAGGDLVIDCGDTFHVRGSVAPSVLNPVVDLHKELIDAGFKIISMTGNHDAETKDASRLTDASTALEAVGVLVIHEPRVLGYNAFVPWIADMARLRMEITKIAAYADTDRRTLFLHAPLNGVIPGLPDHGLDPAWVAKLGFRRVFVGHFHNHKAFPGEVYSVGASTHQTWSDAGSRAGFLIVDDTGVHFNKSRAPEFLDLNAATVDPTELPLLVDGNFVRVKLDSASLKEIDDLRAALQGYGAEGVVINAVRSATVSARTGSTITTGASLAVSVADFIRGKAYSNEAAVQKACAEILAVVKETA
jgi:DNA repair exonuclease SbcCD nuclease subunit